MLKKVLWGIFGLFLAAQFIRPGLENPSVDPNLGPQKAAGAPASVLASLKKACYDCHSNETQWPWYSQIAPVSWWTANHVAEGRQHLNFSTFGQLPPDEQAKTLEEASEALREGEMPLSSYVWMHPQAQLSGPEKQALLAWLSGNGNATGESDDD